MFSMCQLNISRFYSGIITIILGFFAVWHSSAAWAGSFALNEQSVSGLGTAYAGGAAQANDASTIFFNPAGIALLPQGEFQAGLHYIISMSHTRTSSFRTRR